MTLPDHVAVIGGGTMGAGIAHAFAVAGSHVTVLETLSERAAGAEAAVRRSVSKSWDLGRLHDSVTVVLARVATTVDPRALATAGLVIEAVPESVELKREVLGLAEEIAPTAWLATNTSSLSVRAIGSQLSEPDHLIGLHFFNPVPASRLVEIVVTPSTRSELAQAAVEWVSALGKQSITVADSAGFASSRLGVALAIEAMRMLEEGVASAEDIDRAMELGYRHPTGPLRTSDLVGLDVRLAIADHLHRELGARFEPPRIIRDLVAAGDLGQKTGRGFYSWP